jgi:hypothetical protein
LNSVVRACGGCIYCIKESYNRKKGWKSDEVTILTNGKFYDKWHNRETSEYEFLKEIEKLAKAECQKYMTQFPTDDSVWESSLDFPEVK